MSEDNSSCIKSLCLFLRSSRNKSQEKKFNTAGAYAVWNKVHNNNNNNNNFQKQQELGGGRERVCVHPKYPPPQKKKKLRGTDVRWHLAADLQTEADKKKSKMTEDSGQSWQQVWVEEMGPSLSLALWRTNAPATVQS